MLKKFKNAVASFCRSERGSVSVEHIAILAIGAIILYGLFSYTEQNIVTKVETNLSDLLDITVFK